MVSKRAYSLLRGSCDPDHAGIGLRWNAYPYGGADQGGRAH
jgi:hypothetical protein